MPHEIRTPRTTLVPPFQAGDRWGAIGDSITHAGLWHKDIYLFYVTRFPARRFALLNAGVAGDTAGGGVRRLDWDIRPIAPTVATLMFGMNDVGRHLYGAGQAGAAVEAERRAHQDACLDQLRVLASALRESGVALIFLTPTIYDQTAVGDESPAVGVNDALAQVTERVVALAEEMQAPCVDWFTPLHRITLAEQQRDPRFSLLAADRVHPDALGHRVMAGAFLAAQGLSSLVSAMGIDARSGTVMQEGNCLIEVVEVRDDVIAFTCRESALPFPLEPSAPTWLPFLPGCNQQTLTVAGLPAGMYALQIDGELIGCYAAAALAAGIDLAAEHTPQTRQAREVMALNDERHALISNLLRGFVFVEWMTTGGNGGTPNPAALAQTAAEAGWVGEQFRAYLTEKTREAEIRRQAAILTDRLWATAQPVPHRYEIRWL